MRKKSDKPVTHKKKKTPAKKKAVATRKRKPPAKLTKKNIDKCYNAVKYSGKIDTAVEIFGVARQTVYRWIKVYPQLGDKVSHAMAEHKKLIDTNQPEFFVTAVADIKLLLEDRELKTTTVKRKRIVPVVDDMEFDLEADDIEDKVPEDKTITLIEEDITIKKYIREPSWQAIEKVLGKKQLRNIIYDHLHNRTNINGVGMVSKMFGAWMEDSDLDDKWNGSLINDVLDLMLIRTVQAEIRTEYEAGGMELEEYTKLIMDTTKNFGYIAHNRESRAIKLLGGKSFSEIMDGVQVQIQVMIDMMEAVVNDVDIKRKQIPTEVLKRIAATKSAAGYVIWSNYTEQIESK